MKKLSILLTILLCLLPITLVTLSPVKAEYSEGTVKFIYTLSDITVNGTTYKKMLYNTTGGSGIVSFSLNKGQWNKVPKTWCIPLKGDGYEIGKFCADQWDCDMYLRAYTPVDTLTLKLGVDITVRNGNTTRHILVTKEEQNTTCQIGNAASRRHHYVDVPEYTVLNTASDYLFVEPYIYYMSGDYDPYDELRFYVGSNYNAYTGIKDVAIESPIVSYFYFNFNYTDIDDNTVDPRVSWQLHNSSGQVSYTEGQATLTSGTYTLKTYRHGILINETSLDTSIQGNSTVDISLPMKAHTHTSNGYIASNTTISSITILSQTATNLTFTITGSTPCLLMIDVGGQPTNVTKDDLPVSYSYYTSPSKHVRISCSSLSSFLLTWDQPPEQEQGEIPR